MSKNSHDNDLNKHRLYDENAASASESTKDPVKDTAKESTKEASAPDETEKYRKDAEKYKNEYLYLLAEFENYKKNVIKERSDLRKYGSERLVVEILSGLDLLDKALEAKVTADNVDSFRKGIELTSSHFRAMLKNFGVEELPAKGAAFDPNMHEALSSEETHEVPPGHISQVFRKPYKLHERVVRPGQVVVAKTPANKPE